MVRFALERAGYQTIEACDGEEALQRFRNLPVDMVILDVVMPGMQGTDVCLSIRRDSSVPIVFLTSRDEEIDRILGLELGGDDYVTKPFSPRELVARVRAILRRTTPDVVPERAPTLEHGRLQLLPDRFEVRWDQQEVALTVTEFGLLRTLLDAPGRVFTRGQLLSAVYGHDVHITDRTIDSHVRRVRRKFEQVGGRPLETVHGLGYRLGACT